LWLSPKAKTQSNLAVFAAAAFSAGKLREPPPVEPTFEPCR